MLSGRKAILYYHFLSKYLITNYVYNIYTIIVYNIYRIIVYNKNNYIVYIFYIHYCVQYNFTYMCTIFLHIGVQLTMCTISLHIGVQLTMCTIRLFLCTIKIYLYVYNKMCTIKSECTINCVQYIIVMCTKHSILMCTINLIIGVRGKMCTIHQKKSIVHFWLVTDVYLIAIWKNMLPVIRFMIFSMFWIDNV